MKKLLLILTATTMVSVGAFGQGKLSFANDNNHLIYFTTDTNHLAQGDAAYAGNGAYTTGAGGTQPTSSLQGSPTLVAALYGGPSASSLHLQTTTTIANYALEGQVVQLNTT